METDEVNVWQAVPFGPRASWHSHRKDTEQRAAARPAGSWPQGKSTPTSGTDGSTLVGIPCTSSLARRFRPLLTSFQSVENQPVAVLPHENDGETGKILA